ncbi:MULTISPECIES: hypothetical protein [Methylotenera]|uniref:hypothetical protein n=1 Tax=Methylotenera TaxID=359407 RepID=UPI0003805257|nr:MULTISPECIES: hypothetical protein [Methylotenera]
MKKITPKLSSILIGMTFLMAAVLCMNASAKDAVDSVSNKALIVSVSNPNSSYGIQIGDALVRKVIIKAPLSFELAANDLPKKGKKDKGIELTGIDVKTDVQKTHTFYTLNLHYQPFNSSTTPVVMSLPVENFRITHVKKSGNTPQNIELPAWNFWFSPIVIGGIDTAEKNMQPDVKPPLVENRKDQILLILFAVLLVGSVLIFVYINADGQWLPFTRGAFSRAHRQIKRLSKKSVTKTAKDEKQALVYLHEAFNQHYGANIFARDIDHFIQLRPTFKKMKVDIEQFFDDSNHSLYAIETNDSAKVIEGLLTLSKQLRHCERGI